MGQNNIPKYEYEKRMLKAGFVKVCHWINPADKAKVARKAEISRNKLKGE